MINALQANGITVVPIDATPSFGLFLIPPIDQIVANIIDGTLVLKGISDVAFALASDNNLYRIDMVDNSLATCR